MGRELSHGDVKELLGAFALDAVEDDERSAVEDHLQDCPACRNEVAEHREVVGMMAAGWLPAPDGLWDRIARSLEESPPPMRVATVVPLDQERRRRRRFGGGVGQIAAAVAACAAVATVAVLGVKVIDTSDKVGDVERALEGDALVRAANAAAASPDARRVTMRSVDGRLSTDAVLLPDGSGYLLSSNLPELPSDRTWQMWAVVGTDKISVGVLGPKASRPVAFRAAGNVSALAITEEEAGGVVSSARDATVLGTVPSR